MTNPSVMIHSSPERQKKKKKRYSSEQKRLAKQLRNAQDQEHSQAGASTNKKAKKQPRTLIDRMLSCARNATFTQSVSMEQIPKPQRHATNPPPQLKVITSSKPIAAKSKPKIDGFNSSTATSTPEIKIQPLLILDLNGILCHRDRHGGEESSSGGGQQRVSVGHCAGTPIIPRPNVANFLTFLDQHFCLAVWTSAKRKTANDIINLLFPQRVRSRLLFVWAQNECLPVPDDAADERVFQKLLHKVWKAFPLWNANNTLLMDDSPAKCPYAIANGIHPPRIHGQIGNDRNRHTEATSDPWLSDDQNQELQNRFFTGLSQHWKSMPFEQIIETDEMLEIQEQMSNVNLSKYLRDNGSHMGWRDTTRDKSA
jgi:hypothetical protein